MASGSTRQRCRVHFMRGSCREDAAAHRIGLDWPAFAQDDAEAARKQWRQVADQARPRQR
jgi:transposase-like protein